MTDVARPKAPLGEGAEGALASDPLAAAARACLEAADAASRHAAARLCAADGHDAGEWCISAARVLGACADVLGALGPAPSVGSADRVALAGALVVAGLAAAEGCVVRCAGDDADDTSVRCLAASRAAVVALRACGLAGPTTSGAPMSTS
jgi:hypothetical protein